MKRKLVGPSWSADRPTEKSSTVPTLAPATADPEKFLAPNGAFPEPPSSPVAAAADYRPTESERRAVEANFERQRSARSAPALKLRREGDTLFIGSDHPDPKLGMRLLYEALATTDEAFFDGMVSTMIDATMRRGEPEPKMLNFMISVVKGIEPRDQLEAMMAAQMAAVHVAILSSARTLAHTSTIPQQDSAERTVNKLARTFATQLEALKRYRSTGEQKVTVQHVTVNDGGQAVVGTVTTGGRGEEKR
jgi:hypothetical protein